MFAIHYCCQLRGSGPKRLIRTGRYLRDKHKIILDKNYDSHVPQLMRPELFEKNTQDRLSVWTWIYDMYIVFRSQSSPKRG